MEDTATPVMVIAAVAAWLSLNIHLLIETLIQDQFQVSSSFLHICEFAKQQYRLTDRYGLRGPGVGGQVLFRNVSL